MLERFLLRDSNSVWLKPHRRLFTCCDGPPSFRRIPLRLAQPDWCRLSRPSASSQNAAPLFRMDTGYLMLSLSSTCTTLLSRQSAKPPISNGNFTSESRCSCDACPTWKAMRAEGISQKHAHFPVTPGLLQLQWSFEDSMALSLLRTRFFVSILCNAGLSRAPARPAWVEGLSTIAANAD